MTFTEMEKIVTCVCVRVCVCVCVCVCAYLYIHILELPDIHGNEEDGLSLSLSLSLHTHTHTHTHTHMYQSYLTFTEMEDKIESPLARKSTKVSSPTAPNLNPKANVIDRIPLIQGP
jgi:hypothetical protein